MIRRVGIHLLLLFSLAFQSLALAMPCCAPHENMDHSTHEQAVHDTVNVDLHDEACTAGSPLCCAVPSLPHTPSIAAIQNLSSVYVPTVHAFSISFHPPSPERPPRL